LRAPAAIRAALSLRARPFNKRMLFVRSSCMFLEDALEARQKINYTIIRIIFTNLGLLVRECRFGGNNRLRKPNINDLSIGCEFLSLGVSRNIWPVTLLNFTQIAENARRSTNGLSEHRFVPRSEGNISIRLSTRYTVVPLEAASLSMAVSECTKCDTSAMSITWALQTRQGEQKCSRNTHERRLQCCHLGGDAHGVRHLYPPDPKRKH
jgi:hypothetical protein